MFLIPQLYSGYSICKDMQKQIILLNAILIVYCMLSCILNRLSQTHASYTDRSRISSALFNIRVFGRSQFDRFRFI